MFLFLALFFQGKGKKKDKVLDELEKREVKVMEAWRNPSIALQITPKVFPLRLVTLQLVGMLFM